MFGIPVSPMKIITKANNGHAKKVLDRLRIYKYIGRITSYESRPKESIPIVDMNLKEKIV
jgi:hypothetical protein